MALCRMYGSLTLAAPACVTIAVPWAASRPCKVSRLFTVKSLHAS